MDKVKIGVIVNTHGLKGELRVMSGTRYSNNDFQFEEKMWIGDIEVKVLSARKHKSFNMITLDGYDNINDVEHFKGKSLYIDSNKVANESNYESMIGKKVVQDGEILATVKGLSETPAYKLLVLSNEVMVPLIDQFAISVDAEIEVKNVKGFLF